MRIPPIFAAMLIALLTSHPSGAAEAIDEASASTVSAQDPATYMASVARQPGVTLTASGLAYKVMQSGPTGGAHPRLGDQVRVAYEGRLVNGSMFDSSNSAGGPVVLTIGQLVPGWNEALQLMRPGDDWTLYVPPSLGYGDQAAGPIPPNSVMIFRLQLLAILPPTG
jgi:peptidylprolyl isomerase/FKBP-type peptidyl-prolyl cis-trans isomerase FklB